jgi:hypothetical protein
MKEFFEKIPPYTEVEIDDLYVNVNRYYHLNTPEISIHCDNCGGERYFQTPPYNASGSLPGQSRIYFDKKEILQYEYSCKNCGSSKKHFSVMGYISSNATDPIKGKLTKIGEFPPFGPPTPSKVIELIGSEKENFHRGQRCESQGMGIGAYAYYRRIVELHKNRIIDLLLKICKLNKNDTKLIEQLEKVKGEYQFSTAIKKLKIKLPDILLINGHNPLILLHSALSKGIHELTDEECLERANSIRIVLTELCIRMSELSKDNNELKNAVNFLNKLESESHNV